MKTYTIRNGFSFVCDNGEVKTGGAHITLADDVAALHLHKLDDAPAPAAEPALTAAPALAVETAPTAAPAPAVESMPAAEPAPAVESAAAAEPGETMPAPEA